IVREVGNSVNTLRGSAVSAASGQALHDAAAAVSEFGNVDKRVRDYLKADESLMASDIVFSESTAAASRAAVQVEAARLAEHQAFDADEATLRRLEAYAIGAAAGLSGLILAILGLVRGSSGQASAAPGDLNGLTTGDGNELPLRESSASLGRMAPQPP